MGLSLCTQTLWRGRHRPLLGASASSRTSPQGPAAQGSRGRVGQRPAKREEKRQRKGATSGAQSKLQKPIQLYTRHPTNVRELNFIKEADSQLETSPAVQRPQETRRGAFLCRERREEKERGEEEGGSSCTPGIFLGKQH